MNRRAIYRLMAQGADIVLHPDAAYLVIDGRWCKVKLSLMLDIVGLTDWVIV
jgi:hypothetical protein